MPNKPAISVESLSKVFRLYPTRRSRMLELAHPLRRKFHKKFHVLKNISFTVDQGEVLGLIGQNGSGKSTILKILASVVTPTSGSIVCNGRVTALLELGGGFDMDLTGIENVYFLGAIQGYTKKEMKERLDMILDFAEIGEYANQPVKNYSSGMYVRLAFSINININPDILIIDEALSVGDIRFQQKCFRKIREFKKAGKTIVFCSHSMAAIRDFCTRVIWLHQGDVKSEGDPGGVTEQYELFMAQGKGANKNTNKTTGAQVANPSLQACLLKAPLNKYAWINTGQMYPDGNGELTIAYATMLNKGIDESTRVLHGGEELRLAMIVESSKTMDNAGIKVQLNGPFGVIILSVNSYHHQAKLQFEVNNPGMVAIDFKMPLLSNGNYSISLIAQTMVGTITTQVHSCYDAILFKIANPNPIFNQKANIVIPDVNISTLPITM